MENYENDLSLSAKIKIKNLTAGIVYQDKRSSRSTYFKTEGSNALDKNTLWNISFLNGYLKYANTLSDKISLNSMLYYRNATVNPNSIGDIIKATDTYPGSQIGYYRPNALVGTENQINYKAGKRWMIIGGVIGEIEWLSAQFSTTSSLSEDKEPAEPPKPEMLDNYLFSYYAQAEYAISDYLSLTGGIRHDISSYYGQVVTPRTGLIFNKDKLTAKILYNRAFRAPKPWDYKYGIGNGGLNPEKMNSFETDLSYSFMENLSIGASLYKNWIEDKLTLEIVGDSYRIINKDKLSTLGYELYANYSLKKLLIYANYTYSDSYDQEDVFIPEISMHTANAGFTYSCSKHIKINLRANYLGERKNPLTIPNTGNNIIDNALILNGCLSFLNFNGLDFQLKVNNILNQEYYHPSNLFAGRYRQPQRTFALKISYNF